MRHACLLLPLLFALPACTSTRPPDFTITSASVTQRTDSGVVINFNVMADNRNGDALPLREVEYDVELDGKTVFRGTRSAEATVRRYGTQEFTLPAAVPVRLLPDGSAVPFTVKGRVTYLVPGALAETLFDIDVIRPSTPFSGDGVVDLRAQP